MDPVIGGMVRGREGRRASGAGGGASPRLFAQAGGSLLARAGGATLNVAGAFVLAALLGPDAYGRLAYALSWAALLAPLAGLGLDALATRELARARAAGDMHLASAFARWALRTGLVAALTVAAAVAAVVSAVPPARLPAAAGAVGWTAVLLVPLALLRPLAGLLQGSGRVVAAQFCQSLLPPLPVVLGAPALAALGMLDPEAALALHLSGALAAVGVAGWLVRSELAAPEGDEPSVADAAPGRWRRLWPFTLLAATGVFGTQIGTVVAGTLAGPAQAAVFDLALRASNLVALVLFAVNAPVGPAIASAWRRGARGELRAVFRWATRTATAAGLAAACLALAAAPFVADRLGPGYAALPVVLAVLCGGQLVNAACGPVGWLLAMTGHERRVLLAHAGAAAVQLFLAVVLVPVFGALGAALAASAALASWNLGLRLVARHLGLP